MKNKFQTANVTIIAFAHLLHDTYSAFLAPILPLLIDKLGISLFQAGLLDVMRKLPSLANPFIGLIADKVSVRYFVIFSPLITAICMSLLGIAPTYLVLLVLLFVAGISNTLFHVPSPVMIKHISSNQIGKGMSFYMLGGELARTIGPLAILGAVSLWKLEGTYRLLPFSLLATIILFIKLRKIKVTQGISQKEKTFKAREVLIKLLPFFFILSGFLTFRQVLKICLTMYLPTYLTQNGSSLWIAGISLSVLQFSGAIGTLFAGSISDKISRRTSLLIISIANPLLMWIFLLVQGPLTFVVLVIMGFFLFASGPVVLALVHDIDSEHPSFINGTFMMINFVMSSIIVLLVGFLGDKIGLDLTYKISSVLSLGAIPFVFFLPKKSKYNLMKR
ncbi:MAG: MFS transporter [Candidatus Cloacimonetes bacterium]|nr:MFS transporter [Candidatus Cloacimonadota bacterium]